MDIIDRLFWKIASSISKDAKGVNGLAIFKERLHRP